MKEYNSIHSFYYTYHKTHGTDHLLERVESAEEAKLFFKRVGEDLQQASEEIRKLGKEDFPFKSWKSDPRFLISFLLYLGAMTVLFLASDKSVQAIASTIMLFSGMSASFPVCYLINVHTSYRKLIKTSRKFQDDRFFKRKSEQKIVGEANYFIAKQNKTWEENQVPSKDEHIPHFTERIWM